ncbi:D-glycero-alpha-D-manno-heptose-1,7-bisphosphate 7-phosphatase [Mangrovivirga cuniculi]|uniref:D,D-heptose 1,7-bisphosphate phosphatase n=1 Tax=Mangrovivirga cuniculi TaxID=2715131 RepID=A0A4D7JV33_9BACT|nr:HAD-IIIA family hydrolase [Mangrovivirga cuniculi]QCK14695.1 D,D-heptose 1,7-bisphosphate phosphatase [Mangrovivirga cuniculi]
MQPKVNSYKNKAIFLDRDGVINRERGEYTFKVSDFEILPGVIDGLKKLKLEGYKLLIITNQAGISRGLYSRADMQACHDYLHQQTDNIIDAVYFCPWHPTVSKSLSRKPAALMFERAINKFMIDPDVSFMIGDKDRDLLPAKRLKIKTVGTGDKFEYADLIVDSFHEFVKHVLS